MSVASMSREMTFIDLFAGCGGFSLGMSRAGFQGVLAIERDAAAFQTFKVNLVDGSPRRCRQFKWPEIMAKEPATIQSFLGLLKRSKKLSACLRGIDVVVGSPPCQGFSLAGRRRYTDPRNQLFHDYIKVVSYIRPKLVALENVIGVTIGQNGKGAYSERIVSSLRRLGYECHQSIHYALEFGVPQRRPRFFLLAVDRNQIDLGDKNFSEIVTQELTKSMRAVYRRHGLNPCQVTTVRDAISDLEVTGKKLEDCPDAKNRLQIVYQEPSKRKLTSYQKSLRRNAPKTMNSMRLAKHSSDVEGVFKKLIDYAHSTGRKAKVLTLDEREGVTKTRKHGVAVLHSSQPSPTLTTLPDDLIHYSEPRILTVREYARLQSFPDWFEFLGKYTTGGGMRALECPRYTQVGNSVAPNVSEGIGLALRGILKKLDKS
jgi:DNA (cytosine-5)-methyltransferase 1